MVDTDVPPVMLVACKALEPSKKVTTPMAAELPELVPSEAVRVTEPPRFTDVTLLLRASDVGVTVGPELLLLQPAIPRSAAAATRAVEKIRRDLTMLIGMLPGS